MKRTKQVLADCLRKNKAAVILFAAATLFNGAVFWLYGVIAEPFAYAEVLLAAVLLLLLGVDFGIEWQAAKKRELQQKNILLSVEECGNTLRDRDYAEMLRTLAAELDRLQTDYAAKRQADDDYYTAWVHQIKTPIASMKLQLTADTPENRALSSELFRIERYVEMVLDYIRLESDAHDLLIREYELDAIIREVLRKLAPQFILRRLRLAYEPTGKIVVTDKRWLAFILEQLISNAVKYTPEGTISVTVTDNAVQIADSGIGIAPEDLPRVFEKGYTGANGRLGQKSSGLGLFLTKKAADLLAVRVTVQSEVGKGSVFSVVFPEEMLILLTNKPPLTSVALISADIC